MNELKNKRLLVLGGSMWKELIREFADKNDITVIATGNNTSAGIFKIADEAYNINSIDSKAIKNLIINKNIDGVYLGGSEIVISYACQYLEELGMPCYVNKEQWNSLSNKRSIKRLYKKFNIPCVKEYSITENNINNITVDYPVVTKPVDGSGSNGFSICNNLEELKYGYKLAKKASLSGQVLVEDYVNNDSIVVIGRIKKGSFKVLTVEDKFTVKYDEHGTFVAGMHLFESKRKNDFIKKYEKKINDMLESLDIQEGPIWFEVFLDGDNYCFNEAGFRYSGSITIWPIQYFAGINEVAEDIYYSLTGESGYDGNYSIIPHGKDMNRNYCIYSLHLKPGKICSVNGTKTIKEKNNVISIPTAKNIGDYIENSGSVGQVYGFVHFTYENIQELKETINEIHSHLQIVGENGENLLVRKLDLEKVVKGIKNDY